MPKPTKPKRKPAKRGPKELVLKITEDPGDAIKRFIGSKTDTTVTPAHGDPLQDQIRKRPSRTKPPKVTK